MTHVWVHDIYKIAGYWDLLPGGMGSEILKLMMDFADFDHLNLGITNSEVSRRFEPEWSEKLLNLLARPHLYFNDKFIRRLTPRT